MCIALCTASSYRLPASLYGPVPWTQYLRSQAAVACDFATVDTALPRRYYLLFFVELAISAASLADELLLRKVNL